MLIPFLIPLVLTILLEEGFALLWGLQGRRQLWLAALVNCLTNPPVNLLYSILTTLRGLPPLPVAAFLETVVVLVEWMCYRHLDSGIRRPFLLSLCANAFSYAAGYLLQILL